MPEPEKKIEDTSEELIEAPIEQLPPKEEVLEPSEKAVEQKPEVVPEQKLEAEPSLEEKLEEKKEEAPTPTAPPAKVQQQVKELEKLDRENQIKALTDLALQKGVDFAVEVAKKLDSAYTLDEFHDTLVDQLYNKLTEQGKLKKL